MIITSYFILGQHRTSWQEHSAKDFASYESYKRAGILYVFPPFITARMGQKIGRRPQTQLCGDALALEWLFVRAAPVMLLAALVALILLRKRKSDCQKTSLKTCVTEQRGGVRGAKSPPRVQSNRILKLF